MKIRKVEAIVTHRAGRDGIERWNPTFVRVHTDEGLSGVGEVGLAYGVAGSAAAGMVKDLSEAFLLDQDPLDTERLWETMFRRSFWGEGGGPVVIGAISALDTALWDIKGQALGQPVWRLLGGKVNDDLRCYASQLQFGWSASRFVPLGEPALYCEAAQRAVADGYDCVKIDPVQLNVDATWSSTTRGLLDPSALRLARRRMEAIREGVGPNTDIILELHSLCSVSGAQQLIEHLADLQLLFVEEPVHYASPQAHQDLRQRVPVRLSAGERLYTRWGVAPYLQPRALDVLQPDIGLVGGLTEAHKVCALAHLHDVTVQAHVCGGPVATAAALHLEAAIPNFEIHEHHIAALQAGNREMCNEDLQPVKGRFQVPDRPGLGVSLSDAVLRDADWLQVS